MAYGGTELDQAAAMTDQWLQENAVDLLAAQDPFLAILYDNSQEPGGDFSFQNSEGASGETFKIPVFGKGPGTARGTTRSAQPTGYTPALQSVLTNSKWKWAQYEAMAFYNARDMDLISGEEGKVNLGDVIIDSVISELFTLVGFHLWDQQAGDEDRVQSVTQCLLNSGTVGDIDTTDSANQPWWNAGLNSDTEAINPTMFSKLINGCQHNFAVGSIGAKASADIAFVPSDHYAAMQNEWVHPAQRSEVNVLSKIGSKYIVVNDVRVFRNPKFKTSEYGTAAAGKLTIDYTNLGETITDRGVILNSTVWSFRYKFKAPKANAETWIPVSGSATMFERGYRNIYGLGCKSIKHNAMYTNKTAA